MKTNNLSLSHLLDPVVDELPLRLDELLPVLGGLVEEAGVDLGLLVLHADVARQDVAVLERLGHVGVPAAVVHDDAPHQLRVGLGAVLHLHDLDHVQVAVLLVDGEHGVHADVGQLGGDSIALKKEQKKALGRVGSPCAKNICMNYLEWAELLVS